MRENIMLALISDPAVIIALIGALLTAIIIRLVWDGFSGWIMGTPRRRPIQPMPHPPRERPQAVEMPAITEVEVQVRCPSHPRTPEPPTSLRDRTDPKQKALAAAPKMSNGTLVMRRRVSSGRPKAGSHADVPDRPPVSVSDLSTDTGAIPNTPAVYEPDEEEDDLLERETFRVDPATSQTELDRDWAIAAATLDDSDDEPATIIEKALEPTVPAIPEPTVRTMSDRAKPKKKE